jgi:hypothetical protein
VVVDAFVTRVIADWTSVYANHAAVRTSVGFLHVAGLIGGGGCAIAADRATLAAARLDGEARQFQLGSLRNTHRVVLFGLALVIVSGCALFAADVDTFLHSRLFWLKMSLVALLFINGGVLVEAERRAQQGYERAWTALRVTAISSLVLWFLTTLAGAALPNVG